MPTEVKGNHHFISISDRFRLAHCMVDYHNYENLYREIADSSYQFDDYFRSMNNLNRKFEWLTIRKLLLEMGEENDILYDEHGKPHFKEGEKHLSISHSQERVAVSIHGEKQHGIDLQLINPKIVNIRDKFLCKEEVDGLETNSTLELTIYWSMKEALFKLYGKKDIFLKANLLIEDLKKEGDLYSAIGKITNVAEPMQLKMQARILHDYILAYTLID